MTDIIFYKIVCKDEKVKEIYIGQTVDLCRRTANHKHHSKKLDKQIKLYTFINSNGGWDNWNIEEICKMKFNSKYDAKIVKTETFFIKLYDAKLNTCQRDIIIVSIEKDEKEKTYRALQNTALSCFIDKTFIRTDNDKDRILKTEIYKIYNKWCVDNRTDGINKIKFNALIADYYFNKPIKSSGNWYYKNIKLVN